MNFSKEFVIIKGHCDRAIKDPSKQHLADLKKQFHETPPNVLQYIQEYVLFPLELQLRRDDVSSDTKWCVVDCLKELVHCTEIKSLKIFLRLFSLVLLQIFDKNEPSLVANVPEELKLSVIVCVSELMKGTAHEVNIQLYNKTNTPMFSQAIFLCVQIMQREKLRSLRVAAMECVLTIAQVHDKDALQDSAQRHRVGEMIMFLLPGILAGLLKVATGDKKQGQLVTLVAVRAWSRILALVLEDGTLEERPPGKITFTAIVTDKVVQPEKTKGLDREQMLQKLESQSRTSEWISDVAQKVCIHVESLSMLQQHSHWKVRLELVQACHHILDKCMRNLKSSGVKLLELLVIMSEDENEMVATKSKSSIEMLARKWETDYDVSLLQLIKENVYGLISRLPRVLHSTDENHQLVEASMLRLLASYLKILGPSQLTQLLESAPHLQRLLHTLVQIVQLETSGMSLLEDCSLRDLEASKLIGLRRSWKQFKHFPNTDTLQTVDNICNLLGQFGDLDLLSDQLLDMFNTFPHQQKEAVLLLNAILAGGSSQRNLIPVVKSVLDIYLQPCNWYLPLSVQEVGVTQAQRNLQQCCLLAEGVGCMARVLGSAFSPLLLRTLYPLLERAGSTLDSLATAGTLATLEVALAMGCGDSLTALLAANLNYFTHHVTLRLRKLEHNPGVLDVLSLAMRYSSLQLLPGLQEIVSDVLLQSFDTFQDQHTVSFLQVFHTFFVCVKRWLNTKSVESGNEFEAKDVSSSARVVNTLLKYHEDKQFSKHLADVKSVEEDQENKEECDVSGEAVPTHVEMTEAILKRCVHLLPSRDQARQLLVLQTLEAGVPLMAGWDNRMLPMVHIIWQPLSGRFNSTADPLLLNRNFSLLCTLADLAGDFIRSRTLKQVLPTLCQYLMSASRESWGKDSGNAYRFTQAYKLQHELLARLGDLAANLCLQEKELLQLLTACTPYLSCQQPHTLQECCVKLLMSVATYDPDATWLHITSLTTNGNTEFQKNGEEIQRYLKT